MACKETAVLFATYLLVLRRRKLGQKLKVTNSLWLNQYLRKKGNNVLNGKSLSKKLVLLKGNTPLDICE